VTSRATTTAPFSLSMGSLLALGFVGPQVARARNGVWCGKPYSRVEG
jgi:hypothetical protein